MNPLATTPSFADRSRRHEDLGPGNTVGCPDFLRRYTYSDGAESTPTARVGQRFFLFFIACLRGAACKRLTNRAWPGLASPCWIAAMSRVASPASNAGPSSHKPGNTRER